MQKQKRKPLQWLVLVLLIFIFIGIMLENMRAEDDSFIRVNTYQALIRRDANTLLNQVRQIKTPKVAYQEAYLSFTHEAFKESYLQILPYALSGNIDATLIMGFLNEFGQDVPKDFKRAAIWYYIGIRQNHYNRRALMRGLHAYNTGQYQMAAEWFRLASQLNVDRA
ncbi:SEL1-like repeat protein [Facilibium subflavum]|uniref:sel1 repeat family protein n=1 Tax=Facilibium subflavum TaxID=2219058 RepID=UPI000E650C9F|nr:sel1 repeat family protein [Facilibium subflavum]